MPSWGCITLCCCCRAVQDCVASTHALLHAAAAGARAALLSLPHPRCLTLLPLTTPRLFTAPPAAPWTGTCSRSCSRSWRSARCTWCAGMAARRAVALGGAVASVCSGSGAAAAHPQRGGCRRLTHAGTHRPCAVPCAGARPPAGRLVLHQRHALPPRHRRRLRCVGRARLGLRRPAALVCQGGEQLGVR